MNTNEVKDALFPNCPIRNILSRIGDKWSMLVLYTLETDEAKRFKELQRNIPDISQKMLTATLKMLEADGLVKREAFAEVPHVSNTRSQTRERPCCHTSTPFSHGLQTTWTTYTSREDIILLRINHIL